jgi:hypothetical protein
MDFVELFQQCVQAVPEERPSAEEVAMTIRVLLSVVILNCQKNLNLTSIYLLGVDERYSIR